MANLLDCASARGHLVAFLARRELQRRYAGSLLGWWWGLVFPVLQIATLFAVLYFGLGIKTYDSYPLAVALVAGIAAWSFLNEATINMTLSIANNAALIRNSAHPIEIFPVASLFAALASHCVILAIVIAGLALFSFPPTFALLSLPYAIFSSCALMLAAGTLLSVANAAFRDITQATTPLITLGFWLTPVAWSETRIPVDWLWLVWLNPAAHIVKAYRHALLGDLAPAPALAEIVVFWAIVLTICVIAVAAVRSFRQHLGDNL